MTRSSIGNAAGGLAIREARSADHAGLVELWFSLAAEGTAADPRYVLQRDIGPEVARSIAENWLGEARTHHVWVAVRHETLVGYMAARRADEHFPLAQVPTLIVTDAYVAEGHRRAGVGRALARAVHEHAGRNGIRAVEVGTLALDTRAVAFWRSLGFGDWRVTLRADLP